MSGPFGVNIWSVGTNLSSTFSNTLPEESDWQTYEALGTLYVLSKEFVDVTIPFSLRKGKANCKLVDKTIKCDESVFMTSYPSCI